MCSWFPHLCFAGFLSHLFSWFSKHTCYLNFLQVHIEIEKKNLCPVVSLNSRKNVTLEVDWISQIYSTTVFILIISQLLSKVFQIIFNRANLKKKTTLCLTFFCSACKLKQLKETSEMLCT